MFFTRFAIRLFVVIGILVMAYYLYTIYHAVSQSTVMTLATGKRYIVHPDLLVSSGLGKGEIGKTAAYGNYSLINPEHISITAAIPLQDTDLVIGISMPDGSTCAYARSLLLRHQVINETLDTHAIVIALCPFTDTVSCFKAMFNGDVLRFGVSGMLYLGSLVIYDQATLSYWSTIEGRALMGPMSGCQLEQLPLVVMTWQQWCSLYPETRVVCDYDDGTDYDFDPYCKLYMHPEHNLYGTLFSDHRLLAHTPVVGVIVGDEAVAYPVEKICNLRCVQDTINGTRVLVTAGGLSFESGNYPIAVFDRRVHNATLSFVYTNEQLKDKKTHSVWSYQGCALAGPLAGTALKRVPVVCTTWFTWSLFHPTTRIY